MQATKTAFEARAIKVFGKNEGGAAWPTGLNDPFPHYQRTDPAHWERQVAEQPVAQRVAVEWAERYGFKRAPYGETCCINWLTLPSGDRCKPGRCARDIGLDDHSLYWLLDGAPAAVTSAPYNFDGPVQERLAQRVAKDNRLKFKVGGGGWYGYHSTQILVWRGDLIEEMDTAPDAGRGADS